MTSGEPSLAVTMYALRNRGLVTMVKQHGAWVAHVTDAGRFYLEHGKHPDEEQDQTV